MLTLLDQLSAGSYKGVEFFIEKSSISGGRKDVQHSYPNSDKQNIEDLGKIPRVYNITAIITADVNNKNYLQRRNLFMSALEQGGVGTLVHPLYGQIDNVAARTFTLLEELTELGGSKIDIVFAVSDAIGIPTRAKNSLSLISQANELFNVDVKNGIAGSFSTNASNLNSVPDAIATVNGMIDSFNESTNVIQASSDQINTFNSQLSDMTASVTTLVQAPQELADSIATTFNLINSLYPTVEATADVFIGLFGFNDDVSPRMETTDSRIERNKNDSVIKSAMQSLALSNAYLNVAQTDFETVAEIETKELQLETQFKKVINQDGLLDSTKSTLIDYRAQMQEFFNDQKLTARQLIEIKTHLTTARLLSFQYYADSSQGERIARINNTDDVSFIDGFITILTE